jgi:hypothetical protein
MTIRFLGRWGGRWDLSSVGLHAAIKKLDRHKSEPFRIGVSLINGAHDAFCELVTACSCECPPARFLVQAASNAEVIAASVCGS